MRHPPRLQRGWHNHPRWDDERFIERLSMRPPQQFRMKPRLRLLLPVIVSLIIQLPAAMFWLVRTPDVSTIVSAVLAVVGPLALLAARRFPGPMIAFVAAAACVDFILAGPTQGPPFIALAFAIVLAIARGARVWAWASVGATWIATVTIGLVLGLEWHPARIALTTLGILIVFGVGESVRTRREQYREVSRLIAQRRQSEVQAERVRIARELHDVLAHSLSQINVQAGVGLHLMDKQPAKAAEALASIKETSKTALDEVRSVLGILRAEGGQDPSAPLVPEPDLSRLPGLAASVTSQGVDVTLLTEVTTAPKAVQLAIYRIVQESLTNALKHAESPTAVTVSVRFRRSHTTITVNDDGASASTPGTGHGLVGMRERVALYGGTLESGPTTTGTTTTSGWRVTATLPHTRSHE